MRENYQLYKRYIKNIALIYNRRRDIRSYIEMLLSISVIVIFGIFAIRPTLVTIAELRNEIKEKEQILNQLNQKVLDLESAQTLVQQNRSVIILVDTAVPDGPLPVVYIRQIEGLVKRHSVSLLNLDAQRVFILGKNNSSKRQNSDSEDSEENQEETVFIDRYPQSADSVEFSFDVYGDFSNVLSFIADMERLRRPMFIDKMSVRPDEEGNGSTIVISILGRVPFLVE